MGMSLFVHLKVENWIASGWLTLNYWRRLNNPASKSLLPDEVGRVVFQDNVFCCVFSVEKPRFLHHTLFGFFVASYPLLLYQMVTFWAVVNCAGFFSLLLCFVLCCFMVLCACLCCVGFCVLYFLGVLRSFPCCDYCRVWDCSVLWCLCTIVFFVVLVVWWYMFCRGVFFPVLLSDCNNGCSSWFAIWSQNSSCATRATGAVVVEVCCFHRSSLRITQLSKRAAINEVPIQQLFFSFFFHLSIFCVVDVWMLSCRSSLTIVTEEKAAVYLSMFVGDSATTTNNEIGEAIP